MAYFFTSDTHFGHSNIITYSSRPFDSVEKMDEEMINEWNSLVTNQDTVFHLGDFAFANAKRMHNILTRLNGTKHLIFGNHDKALKKERLVLNLFNTVGDYKELTVHIDDKPQLIVMCHYPMLTWNKSHRGSWMLHGHCHGSIQHPWGAKMLDVGVDNNPQGYKPFTLQQVAEHMKGRSMANHHPED